MERLDPRCEDGPDDLDMDPVPGLMLLNTSVVRGKRNAEEENVVCDGPAFIPDDETDWKEAQDLGVSDHLIREAKRADIRTLEERETLEKIPREEMTSHGPYVYVKTRWVLVNKGTREAPRVKARLAAKEFRTKSGVGGGRALLRNPWTSRNQAPPV